MNRQAVHRVLADCGAKASITGIRISPHTFRDTSAVMYLRNGGDVFNLQRLLGHSDLTTTRRYVELSHTDMIEKHRLYSPADALIIIKQAERKRFK